ncbi:MAG: hypothetical protein KIS92_18205 [Planctomycetota bacterium]|nr:hypothetical protein [Planctomycetota bacterium]
MSQAASAAAPKKSSKLKWVVIGVLAVLLLPVVVLGGLRLYYNDAYIKGEIEKALSAKLGRDVSIGGFELSIFGGTATLENLSVKNKDAGYTHPDTAKVGKISVAGAFVSLALNHGTEVEGLKVEIQKPELSVERQARGGAEATNLDDILARLGEGPPSSWPKETGLKKFTLEFRVRDGIVRYIDKARNLGESRAEGLTVDLSQPGLGQKLTGKASFKLVTPQTPQGGTLDADFGLDLFDAQGRIPHPQQFTHVKFDAKMGTLDVPFLTRLAGMHVLVMDKKIETTLGQAVTGTLTLDAPTLAQASLATKIETPGLVSLWEQGVLKAGQLAARIEAQGRGGIDGATMRLSALTATLDLGPTLASLGTASTKGLNLALEVSHEPAKPPKISVKLASNLGELFSTDVGEALQLKGRVGGKLAVDGVSAPDAQGRWHSEGKLTTDQAFVVMDGVKQPTSADLNFDTTIALDAQGNPEQGEANAVFKSNAFELKSEGPVKLAGLNDLSKLNVQGKLNFLVLGEELWKEFGPLLAVCNLKEPLRERVAGTATVSGTPGQLKADLDATVARQADDKQEMRLTGNIAYDGDALVAAAGQAYLTFGVQVRSARDKSLNLTAQGTSTRFKDRYETDVPKQAFSGTLDALRALAKRFDAYVGALPEGGLKIGGLAQMTGQTRFVRRVDEQGRETARDLSSIAELKLFELDVQAPPLLEGKPPVRWAEKEATLSGEFAQHTEGAASSLSVRKLKLDSATVALELSCQDADIPKLSAALGKRPFAPKDVMAAMPAAKISLQATPECIARMQSFGLLPDDPAARGTLDVQAGYDAQAHALKIGVLTFKGDALDVAVTSQQISEGDLVAVAEAGLAGAEPFKTALVRHMPDVALEMKVLPGAIEALRRLKILAEGLTLQGDGALKARYVREGDRLIVEHLQFARAPETKSAVHQLALKGEISHASKLMAGVPADPGELTKHLEKGLDVISLKVDPQLLIGFLRSLKVGGAALDEAAAGVYAVKELSVQRATVRQFQEPGTLEVIAAGTTNFAYYPRPAPGRPPAEQPEALLRGTWQTDEATPVRVLIKPSGFEYLSGAVALDQTELYCSAGRPYVYRKPAGTPCKLSFSLLQENGLLKVNGELAGGPLAARLNGLTYQDQGGQAVLTVKDVVMTQPLALSVSGVAFDAAADKVAFRLRGEKLEWAELSPYLTLPSTLQVGGTAQNVDVSYQGSLTGLTKSFGPNDRFDFRADLRDISLIGSAPGQPVKWLLNGPLVANGSMLASKALSANLVYSPPDRPPLTQQLALSVQVSGKNGLALLDALKAEGLPLLIVTPVESRSVFVLNGVLDAIGALADAAAGPPRRAKPAAPSRSLGAIRQARLEIPVITVPKMLLSGLLLEDLKVPGEPAQQKPGVTLDNLILELPSASCRMYEGTVFIADGRYDLRKIPGPIAHTEKVTVRGLDLAKLTANPAPAKDAYAIGGTLDAVGTLMGVGFSGLERRTWAGTFNAEVADLTARKPGAAKKGGFLDSMKSEGIGFLGGFLGGSKGKTAAKLYAEDFGLDLNSFAFEPVKVRVAMRNGVAEVEKSTLTAKGANAGLKAVFYGGVDAATERFSPNFTVYPSEVPATTQNLLNLNQVTEQDRAAVLKEFADGKFKAVLEGPLNAFKDNRASLLVQFNDLAERIDRMIANKQAAERAAAEKAAAERAAAERARQQQQQNPPPAQNPPPPKENSPPPAPNPPPPQ